MTELAIFVGGIHGTGKSFFASRYAKDLGLNHISAGELIFQQKNLLEKKVANIGKNQDLLTEGFHSLPSGKYIMDGHYTLLDRRENVMRVPLHTFESLKPNRLLLLVSDVEHVYTRLLERDGKDYSIDLLSIMQKAEKEYYKELCVHFSLKEEIIENNY